MDQPIAENHGSSKRPRLCSMGKATDAADEAYQRITQLEHILLRPDTYIGSVEATTQLMWVVDESTGLNQRSVSFVPGLYKIFDEILVNAADNKTRDATMTTIKITIDLDSHLMSVWNNGRGIPVRIHATEQIYVPELVFGHLLTSSNFNDTEKKITGGRNGYGAKLCNIFSTRFVVETSDSDTGKCFRQVYSDNMSMRGEAQISDATTDDYTCITFQPDLARFQLESLDADMMGILKRRAFDLAATSAGLDIFFNNEQIPVKNFLQYVQLHAESRESAFPIVYERVNDRWEVCVTVSTGSFAQLSFVNSIATTRGGTHVNMLCDQLCASLAPILSKKCKLASIPHWQIRSHLWVFVNCLIENPTFDSQTKEFLTLHPRLYGSQCALSDKFIREVSQTGLVEVLTKWALGQSQSQLRKATQHNYRRGRITGLPKLDDANHAGGRDAHKCTLIVTEGDSAKALAVSGLSVIGRDYYGVFPLRGKLLNVRQASTKQILENAEIQALVKIMGLQFGKVYESTKSLRYGHLMVMADQDHDGSHIKGLLMNCLHYFWPSLMKLNGFFLEFATPIVKATRSGGETKTFFNLPEYQLWRNEHSAQIHQWQVKYYKGLGTSTAAEAKEYFMAINEHQHVFTWVSEDDGEHIDMAFNKKKVEERKTWLQAYVPGTFLDHAKATAPVSFSDFINKELILFSMADNTRSIPSLVDGLKPSQRKILFACFKRQLFAEVKVAQLAGYVAEHSAYHHGEASLCGTIVNMAQNFVGSNNLNLLKPEGQFGTRLQGGKDAASPRYIFTQLTSIARALFPEADDSVLSYLEEDGQQIEPAHFFPILPLVLINGADGIGTGWSTNVPNYNSRDVLTQIRALLSNRGVSTRMMPWWRGFTGDIVRKGDDQHFAVRGRLNKLDDLVYEILELPIGTWTQSYKEHLESLLTEVSDVPAYLSEYQDQSTDTTVHFVLTVAEGQDNRPKTLFKKLKLESSLTTTNMILFNEEGQLQKYESPEEIIRAFYPLRLSKYSERKAWILTCLEKEFKLLDNKSRFVAAVVGGTLSLQNRQLAELIAQLREMGFDEQSGDDGFAYLLNLNVRSFTQEKANELQREYWSKKQQRDELSQMTPEDMWRGDLEKFEAELDVMELERADESNDADRCISSNSRPVLLSSQQTTLLPTTAGERGALGKRKASVSLREKVDVEDDEEEEGEETREEEHDEDSGDEEWRVGRDI